MKAVFIVSPEMSLKDSRFPAGAKMQAVRANRIWQVVQVDENNRELPNGARFYYSGTYKIAPRVGRMKECDLIQEMIDEQQR